MAGLFILLCFLSFIVAGIYFKKSFTVDAEEVANRPDGAFVQANITKMKANKERQTMNVTFDFIVGRENIICAQTLPVAEVTALKLGKTVPVVYNTQTKALIINPGASYNKKRNIYLATAVVLCLCGSYFAITIYPVITWM